jgi:hypothetical protein
MSDYQQKVSGSFNERMRFIRLRRKRRTSVSGRNSDHSERRDLTVVALFVIARSSHSMSIVGMQLTTRALPLWCGTL